MSATPDVPSLRLDQAVFADRFIASLQQRAVTQVAKTWGMEYWLVNTDVCVKILQVLPLGICSVHRHRLKAEAFIPFGGAVQVFMEQGAQLNSSVVMMPPGSWHFFCSKTGGCLLELSSHHADEDVERCVESLLARDRAEFDWNIGVRDAWLQGKKRGRQ